MSDQSSLLDSKYKKLGTIIHHMTDDLYPNDKVRFFIAAAYLELYPDIVDEFETLYENYGISRAGPILWNALDIVNTTKKSLQRENN